jgi:VanZ family protein
MQKWLSIACAHISRFAPPLIMMAVIYWWSAQTDLPGPTNALVWWDFTIKKLAHVIEYGLLYFFLQRAFNWYSPLDERRFSTTFVLVLLYAISDEIHQSFTPGRHSQLRDVGIDMVGCLMVYLKVMQFV